MNALQFSGSGLRIAILIAVLFAGASIFQTPVLQAKDSSTAQTKSAKVSKVDVNSADKTTLETLPGIGPTLAQRIIDGRPYKNATELQKVDGMTKSKVSAIKKNITFGSNAVAKKKSSTTVAKSKKASQPEEAATTSETTKESTSTASTSEKSSTTPTPIGSESGKLGAGETININTASADDLARLPGIGPAKSKAIVEYRDQNGQFKSPEDIMKVKGIKSGEFSKIKDHIKVSD